LSRAGVEAIAIAEADRDARLGMLRADAASAVARLIAGQERLQVMEAQSGDIQRLVEVLRTREREGEGSRFDRLRAEQELQDAQRARTMSAMALAEAKAEVAALLPPGVSLGRIAAVRRDSAPLPAGGVLIAQAHSSRAELRALERAAIRADLEGQTARKARGPVPTVFGGVKRADDVSGRTLGSVLGVNVSVPVFDNGRREAARWSAERTVVDAERAALEEQVSREVSRALEVVLLLHQAVSEDQQASADDLIEIAEVAYREGEVGILELLDAVRTASRARTRRTDIQLDARLAEIALERAVGEVLWP
jgi:cobalt-zinc-cadmium efflux system outer membrane protein